MLGVRNRFSSVRAGGPRQFAELRNKFLIEVGDRDEVRDALSELDDFRVQGRPLSTAPVIVAEPRGTIEEVIDEIAGDQLDNDTAQRAVEELQAARDEVSGFVDDSTIINGATNAILQRISTIASVLDVEFVQTRADYGPENLRVSPSEMPDVSVADVENENATLEDLHKKLGLPEVWETTRGENAIVAIFDTGYSKGVVSEDRIVDTFHADEVDSVYAPAEGHGTMCAGAAAADTSNGTPFNGAAPEAGVILVRTTGEGGQIRSDVIADAWDWLSGKDYDRPVVANHSYGTPICSGRPRRQWCNTPLNTVIEEATADSNLTAVYAAGNEAMTCGHRPSGLTSAITGTNSLEDVIAVGALRYDLREAQRYSSHGRGDCAPISDPKPNVSCALPMRTYYGAEGGWTIKDMSTGIGGSSGGTSHAAPYTTGVIALLQSAASDQNGEALQTEEIKNILERTSNIPHATPVNAFNGILTGEGYDARFGYGQIRPKEAINEVIN